MQDAGTVRGGSAINLSPSGGQQQTSPILSSSGAPESPPDGVRAHDSDVMTLGPASPNAENERPSPAMLQAWRPTVGQGACPAPFPHAWVAAVGRTSWLDLECSLPTRCTHCMQLTSWRCHCRACSSGLRRCRSFDPPQAPRQAAAPQRQPLACRPAIPGAAERLPRHAPRMRGRPGPAVGKPRLPRRPLPQPPRRHVPRRPVRARGTCLLLVCLALIAACMHAQSHEQHG
jgi:hypothetical protein